MTFKIHFSAKNIMLPKPLQEFFSSESKGLMVISLFEHQNEIMLGQW